jgi:hypothetical protein
VRKSTSAKRLAVAYRHYREPPRLLDWDSVGERHKAVCYELVGR